MRLRPRWLPSAHGPALAVNVWIWIGIVCLAGACASPAAGDESVDELKTRLRKALADNLSMQAEQTVRSLLDLNMAKAVEAVTIAVDRGVDPAIVGKIVSLPAGEGLDAVCRLASEHKNVKVRILFTLALAKRGVNDEQAFSTVMQSLMDPAREVVRATLFAIQELETLKAVDYLIQALSAHEGRGPMAQDIAFDIRVTLQELTGQDLQTALDWRSFWEPRRVGYKRPPKGKAVEDASVGMTRVEIKVPRFFNIEVPDKKVLFILDISGSMAMKDPSPEAGDEWDDTPDDDEGRGTTAVAGKKKEKKKEIPQDEIPESRMRLKRVQKELVRVLAELDPDVDFGILTFSSTVTLFKDSLLKANERNKAEAIRYVETFIKPEGETYTDHALKAAFEVQGVTTMYLLSDGAPRRGELLPHDPIIEFVKDANRYRRVHVHAIGFAQAGANLKRFLKRIASVGMGVYKELR